jgi:glycosyltransferase involved in cell wall biosynthesis
MIEPRFVLTLNSHFVPGSEGGAHPFGVVGFVLRLAQALARRGQLAGFVLYRRDPEARQPIVTPTSCLGYPAAELSFHFEMPERALRRAFAHAVRMVSEVVPAEGAASRSARPIVIYHQTNTLLRLTPDEIPFLVTHHGPFASEICRLFGARFACRAFQGGASKLRHLLRAQAHGVAHLKRSRQGAAVELSSVQEAVLRRAGVAASQVWRMPPPMSAPAPTGPPDMINGATIVAPPQDEACDLHLVTATARIDEFKNISLLIGAANRLAAMRVPVRLSLFVGGPDETETRALLMRAIARELQPRTHIAERLPHRELACLLRVRRFNAVFVSTSLYETFGITPLEAMLAGMTTLVPDRIDRIGIAEYMDVHGRVALSEDSLVARLLEWHVERQGRWLGARQRDAILAKMGGVESAVSVLTEAATHVCRPAAAARIDHAETPTLSRSQR